MAKLINQGLDFPDGNYEGGLTVDDKEPELKWAVAGRSAVPELFNWVSRKATEDIQRIIEFLDKYESIRKLTPLAELTQIAGREAHIIYVNDYQPVLGFLPDTITQVSGSVNLVKTEPEIALQWSMPDVENATEPTIQVDVDITGEGEEPGQSTISVSQELTVPNANNQVQETIFDLGDVSQEDGDDSGWDDVRGKELSVFVKRDPGDSEIGTWNLHSVEVR